MSNIRVLIVDDSAFMRRVIRQMLEDSGDVEVVGAARDGAEGVEMALQLKPDVITMDIEMP
ncbi:partial Protein-glutamate methylesterase/protein-glutamine glutaminase, partial [Anaerolineae bacterium]